MPGRSKSPAPKRKSPSSKKSNVDVLRKLFDKIDTDGSGGIDADELQIAMITQFNANLSATEVEDMIDAADLDSNGVIDFDEFKLLMQHFKANKKKYAKTAKHWTAILNGGVRFV
jgi:Ca2+-binding EF-hand superfamily protein